MKSVLIASALVAAAVAAKHPPGYSKHPKHTKHEKSLSTTTVTYDDCPTQPPETLITVTNGVTVTYCPACDMQTTKHHGGHPGYTTVYTTTYESLCPTGVVPATYTVTESCTNPTPTWTPGPRHIPQGFTVTTKMCTVCDSTPVPKTITEPCGCEAHEGTPGPPPATYGTPTPPSGGSGGMGGSPPSGGSSPAAPSCNGEECGGSGYGSGSGSSPSPPAMTPGSAPAAPPYPTPAAQCSGPGCGAKGTGMMPSGASPGASGSSGVSPPVTPPTGNSASSLAIISSSGLTFIIAALAFTL